MPKALLSDLALKNILDEHYPRWLSMQEHHGSEYFNSIDMVLYAFKNFRQQNQAKADALPGFVNLLNKLETKCARAAKKWLEDLNIYHLTNFDPPYRGCDHGFWNTYLALLLHQEAEVSITDEGDVAATGQSQKGWLFNLTYCSNGIVFHLMVESRRIPVSKELKWPDLLDLPSLGITFQDQTSINLAMADMRTPFQNARANDMIDRKHNEKVAEGKQQMDWKELVQRLEQMVAGGEKGSTEKLVKLLEVKGGQNSLHSDFEVIE